MAPGTVKRAIQCHRIYDFRKVKYLFTRMDIDRAKEHREIILKKRLEHEMERCEVIVSDEKPLELKFHEEKEVLTVRQWFSMYHEHTLSWARQVSKYYDIC